MKALQKLYCNFLEGGEPKNLVRQVHSPHAFAQSPNLVLNHRQFVVAILVAVALISNAPKAISGDDPRMQLPAVSADAQKLDAQMYAQKLDAQKLDNQLVQKANQLHEEAAYFFDRQEIEKAIEKEKEAQTLVPDYWLPHAALGYLYFGRGGPAILEAAQSVKTSHPSLADINLGVLLSYFHMYEDSIQAFKRVPVDDSQFPSAEVGIAVCLIAQNKPAEGREILESVLSKGPRDPIVVGAIAKAYFDAGDMIRAKEVCQSALVYSRDQKLTDKLRKLLLVTAVNTADLSILDSLKDQVRPALLPYERGWLRAAEFKCAGSSKQAAIVLRFAETDNSTNLDWLTYASILHLKAFEAANNKADWMQLEKDCLANAEAIEPNNVDMRIMLASIEERLGHRQLALRKVMDGWNGARVEPSAQVLHANESQAKSDVVTLSKSFVKDGKGYCSYVSMIECHLPKVTCHCRYAHFKQAVQQLPGVINVVIGPGDTPTALVLFDSRKVSKQSIFENNAVVNLHENLNIGTEKRVETITELGDLTAKFVPPLPAPAFDGERIALQFPSPAGGVRAPRAVATATTSDAENDVKAW